MADICRCSTSSKKNYEVNDFEILFLSYWNEEENEFYPEFHAFPMHEQKGIGVEAEWYNMTTHPFNWMKDHCERPFLWQNVFLLSATDKSLRDSILCFLTKDPSYFLFQICDKLYKIMMEYECTTVNEVELKFEEIYAIDLQVLKDDGIDTKLVLNRVINRKWEYSPPWEDMITKILLNNKLPMKQIEIAKKISTNYSKITVGYNIQSHVSNYLKKNGNFVKQGNGSRAPWTIKDTKVDLSLQEKDDIDPVLKKRKTEVDHGRMTEIQTTNEQIKMKNLYISK